MLDWYYSVLISRSDDNNMYGKVTIDSDELVLIILIFKAMEYGHVNGGPHDDVKNEMSEMNGECRLWRVNGL